MLCRDVNGYIPFFAWESYTSFGGRFRKWSEPTQQELFFLNFFATPKAKATNYERATSATNPIFQSDSISPDISS